MATDTESEIGELIRWIGSDSHDTYTYVAKKHLKVIPPHQGFSVIISNIKRGTLIGVKNVHDRTYGVDHKRLKFSFNETGEGVEITAKCAHEWAYSFAEGDWVFEIIISKDNNDRMAFVGWDSYYTY